MSSQIILHNRISVPWIKLIFENWQSLSSDTFEYSLSGCFQLAKKVPVYINFFLRIK